MHRKMSEHSVPRVRQLVVKINGNRNATVAVSTTTTTTMIVRARSSCALVSAKLPPRVECARERGDLNDRAYRKKGAEIETHGAVSAVHPTTYLVVPSLAADSSPKCEKNGEGERESRACSEKEYPIKRKTFLFVPLRNLYYSRISFFFLFSKLVIASIWGFSRLPLDIFGFNHEFFWWLIKWRA